MAQTAQRDDFGDERPELHKCIINYDALIMPKSGRKPNRLGHKLMHYANDLYESGAKLWTKEMFLSVEEELSKNPLPTHVQIRRMNDELYEERVPEGLGSVDGENGLKCAHIIFEKYQDILFHTFNFFSDEDFDQLSEEQLEMEYGDAAASKTTALFIGWSFEMVSTSSSDDYSRLKSSWDETRRNWTKSEACKELIAILQTQIRVPAAVSKLVCFGLGNPDRDFDNIETALGTASQRSMAQHAAALTMAATFGKLLGTSPLPVLVQDPAYTPMAQHLLREVGFDVVGGHGSLAFTHVDDDTAVFSCAPNIPVKQIVADIAKPAAMIWDSVKPHDEEKRWIVEEEDGDEMLLSPWTTDEDSPRTRKLVEAYDMFKFPDEPALFGDLEIYIRRN